MLVLNNLEIKLERKRAKVIVFSDNVVIMFTGKLPESFEELMQNALNILIDQYNIDPLYLNGSRLVFTD